MAAESRLEKMVPRPILPKPRQRAPLRLQSMPTVPGLKEKATSQSPPALEGKHTHTSDYVQLMMISLPVRFRECSSSSSGDRKKIDGDGRVCRNLRSKQCHHHLVTWVHDRPVGIISCVARHSNLVHFCRSFLSQSALENFLTPLSVG